MLTPPKTRAKSTKDEPAGNETTPVDDGPVQVTPHEEPIRHDEKAMLYRKGQQSDSELEQGEGSESSSEDEESSATLSSPAHSGSLTFKNGL